MVVPILANAFGGRPSVGLLLPILIFADVFICVHLRNLREKNLLPISFNSFSDFNYSPLHNILGILQNKFFYPW